MTDDSENPIQLNKPNNAQSTMANDQPRQDGAGSVEPRPWGIDQKTFLILFHLSLLTSFMMPLAGIILPLVMWLTNKEEYPQVDAHGKVIANWIISFVIYSFVCVPLLVFGIGFILWILLCLYTVVIVIVASTKASEGVLLHYPLSIKFIK